MSEWIDGAKAAKTIGIAAGSFKSMAKHDYYGLDRTFQNGFLEAAQGRIQYFNSGQIDAVADLRRISGVAVPSCVRVVVAQNGAPVRPEALPEPNIKVSMREVFASSRRRVEQIRDQLPDKKEFNSERFRHIAELLKICDVLFAEIDSKKSV